MRQKLLKELRDNTMKMTFKKIGDLELLDENGYGFIKGQTKQEIITQLDYLEKELIKNDK